MIELRQYGEMRTGTNYLAHILKLNYDVSIYYFNKHEPFDGNEKNTIISFKDPFAWMWSMLNCNLLTKKTLYKGIHTENPTTDYNLQKKLVYRFNKFYDSLLDIPEDYRVIINFDNLLKDSRSILLEIEYAFRLKRKANFLDEKREIRSEERITNKVFDRKDFYLNKKYIDCLSDKTKDIVEYNIDWSLMEEYGYFN